MQNRGRKEQRGSGRFSLCRSCNTMLGTYYVRAYADFTKDLYDLLFLRAHNEREKLGPFLIETRPLNFIKCICRMALSISPPENDRFLEAMRDFVINRDVHRLPAGVRAFMYASRSTTVRQFSSFAALTTHSGPVHFSELYSTPIGVVLTFDSGPLDTRHMEITHFALYGYNQKAEVACTLPILSVDSSLPLY